MFTDAINNFPQQFIYQPVIQGEMFSQQFSRFLIVGMGGSHLAANILQEARPDLVIRIHSDYELPLIAESEKPHTLVILSSYSGNTEEVLSAAEFAKQQGVAMAAIAVGGKLITFAQANKVPYIELPNTGIQPRSALGYSLRALLKIIGAEQDLQMTSVLAEILNPATAAEAAKVIVEQLKDKVPVLYTTSTHFSLAYNWKIKFNENTKIPAFCNCVPELNHNEMNGFDVVPTTRALSDTYAFIFLQSAVDHPNNQKRFAVLKQLYQARNLPVISLDLVGENFYEQIFSSLLVADWVTVYLAEYYGIDPEPVPMVEEFKRLIA